MSRSTMLFSSSLLPAAALNLAEGLLFNLSLPRSALCFTQLAMHAYASSASAGSSTQAYSMQQRASLQLCTSHEQQRRESLSTTQPLQASTSPSAGFMRNIATSLQSMHASRKSPMHSSHAPRGINSQAHGRVSNFVQTKKKPEYAFDDEGQAQNRIKFVSQERKLVPRPPFYRPPIYFPNVSLEMMKLTDEQRQQIRSTGWTREVAFKTTPNVTKLEIKGILEKIYGMQVERVSTINYLGKKYVTYSKGKRPSRLLWRNDDWKKAYVIFRPPAGMEWPPEAPVLEQPAPGMIQQLLEARGLKALEDGGAQR